MRVRVPSTSRWKTPQREPRPLCCRGACGSRPHAVTCATRPSVGVDSGNGAAIGTPCWPTAPQLQLPGRTHSMDSSGGPRPGWQAEEWAAPPAVVAQVRATSVVGRSQLSTASCYAPPRAFLLLQASNRNTLCVTPAPASSAQLAGGHCACCTRTRALSTRVLRGACPTGRAGRRRAGWDAHRPGAHSPGGHA